MIIEIIKSLMLLSKSKASLSKQNDGAIKNHAILVNAKLPEPMIKMIIPINKAFFPIFKLVGVTKIMLVQRIE